MSLEGDVAMSATMASKRILIVDDTKELLQVISQRLKSWGYEVLTASTGEEGLRIASEQLPDLVLLDVMMPKLKGRDACARLKADPKTKHIPVIFLTALQLPDHVKAGLDVGADDYIVKPFEPDELKERIRLCLLRHSGPASSAS